MNTDGSTGAAMPREIEISSILNFTKLQPFMDNFCHSVGIAAAILDLKCEVLASSNWQPICSDFYRSNFETARLCTISDTILTGKIDEGEKFALHTCRNGLTDAAAPICVQGRHIANLFIGQFFMQQPDCAVFRDMAQQFGFDEANYLKALAVVPIIHRDRVAWIMQCLVNFAELLGDMGMQALEQQQSIAAIRTSQESASRIEEHLRHSQKLEAITALATGIVHDFNNILGGIIGYAQLTLRGLPLDDNGAHNLMQILHAADRASVLVKQLGWFSENNGGEFKPVQLSSIVKDVTALLRASIPTTIEIRLALDDAAPLVHADPVQMHQVMVNLCMNAAQAMDERGGLLLVELRPVMLAEAPLGIPPGGHPRCYLSLRVCDTGPGIAHEHMQQIFEPFFTTKESGNGTGMGLAVTHCIIMQHGGAITVENAKNGGAVFTVLLPAVEAPAAAGHVSKAVFSGGNARVLFVDDEHFLADVGAQMLVSLGYSVTTKRNGIDALEEFVRNPHAFDMVITDQTMPGMTGLELARRLKSIKPDIPVILCTGNAEDVSLDKILPDDIRIILRKPVKINQLDETIRHAFETVH